MKMTSRYPRLQSDYFLDAAAISAYPDEKEFLIGFMYSRVLHIELGATNLCVSLISAETVQRLALFVVESLLKNHLFSYGPFLELMFHAMLRLCDCPCDVFAKRIESEVMKLSDSAEARSQRRENLCIIGEKLNGSSRAVLDAFVSYRESMRVLKLDTVSSGMRCVFYEDGEDVVSIKRVHEFAPNIEELQLFEMHKVNNEFVSGLVHFLRANRNSKLRKVKLLKYAFEGDSSQFRMHSAISRPNMMALRGLGWKMRHTANALSYKLILSKHSTNNMK